MSRAWGLPLGLVVAVAAGLACVGAGLPAEAAWTAAITALTATWWVLEPIPIPAASLVPLAAFPLVGVLDEKAVGRAYGHPLILLLLGGFVLSTALARSGAHRRLAVGLVRLVGGGRAPTPRRAVLGFMLASALCSMWISNTATVLMLLPVALATLDGDPDQPAPRAVQAALLLGVAYAASIGGMGTPVGTPPNVVFMGVYAQATGREVSFLEWMRIGVPTVVALLPLAWWVLVAHLPSDRLAALPRAGPWRPAEARVLAVFALTAAAWVLRTEPAGGWTAWLGVPAAGDATVALTAVVALFLLPDGDGGRLLDWQTAERIPWGLLLLFGGGIAIADAFEQSGLAEAMARALVDDAGITRWPALAMIGVICLVVTFLTEVTSNTAITTLLMPVLATAGMAAGIDPAVLMVPAALSASCAFMLPVATAPNAIVFGTGAVTMRDMTRHGLVLNLLGAVAITVLCWALM